MSVCSSDWSQLLDFKNVDDFSLSRKTRFQALRGSPEWNYLKILYDSSVAVKSLGLIYKAVSG